MIIKSPEVYNILCINFYRVFGPSGFRPRGIGPTGHSSQGHWSHGASIPRGIGP